VGNVRWYFDSSVIVSAAVTHHSHNGPALAVLEELISRKHHGYISAHSLTEIYSVLTRTPFKPPLYPSEAWQIIEGMVLPHMELVALTSPEYREVVRNCAASGWSGGRVHDAVHLRCAQKAECHRIYTFNVKDFRALAPAGLVDKITAP
jgi:predicted nucleic acid-binding protein